MGFRGGYFVIPVILQFLLSFSIQSATCPDELSAIDTKSFIARQIASRNKWQPEEINEILEAIESSWNTETSADTTWSLENPAKGQCAVTALVVQDFLGGEIVNAVVPVGENKISHYWNLLNDLKIDLTSKQFPANTLIPNGSSKPGTFSSTRTYILSFPATVQRYLALKSKVVEILQTKNIRPNFKLLAAGPLPEIVSAFDIDKTILSLPTPIVLFSKLDSSFIHVDGDAYAAEALRVGREIPYTDYEVRRAPRNTGSFKYFGSDDNDAENFFLRDIKLALERKDYPWQSSRWAEFKTAMDSYDTAQYTKIITARGHPPRHILEGLEYLKSKGFIRFTPLLQNIHSTAYSFPPERPYQRHEEKAAVMNQALDEYQSHIDSRSQIVTLDISHIIWDFYEDDLTNIITMERETDSGRRNLRWKNIIPRFRVAVR